VGVYIKSTIHLKILHKIKFKPPQSNTTQNHKLPNLKPIIKTEAILTLFLFVNYYLKLMHVFFKHYFYLYAFFKLLIDDLKY
jgi:hypothetical protein